MIAENIAAIRRRIDDACARAGRPSEQVRIVAAAKGQADERIREALEAGIRIFGHNYVQEAARHEAIGKGLDAELHMIGHLQKNKAGRAVDLFHVVETVDNRELVIALDRRARAAGKIVRVMIQVNLAGEAQKSGIAREAAAELARAIRDLPNLRLEGLMTMPPFFDDPARARPYFAQLRALRDEYIAAGILDPEMNELSMGMTGDFEVAVEEGATLVRIGTALFGPRPAT
jgi:pyridoxal phosphate enzyme (YggS family)